MRTQISKAPWVSEDDPTGLGDCAGTNQRGSFRRVERCERVVVVGLIVISMCLMLPAPMLRAPLVNSHEDVMSKVYDELVTGRSSLEILRSLSREERRVVKECEIGWIRSVPVSTAYGVVSPKYVPVEHVVVYGMPEFAVGAKRWRGPWYCDARGARHALLGTDMAAVEVGGDVTRLKKLVLTTRLGTFDILGGAITDISEIGDVEQYDRSLLNKYLILKKLMAKDGDYLRYAIGCMGEMDDWFDWVQPLVKRSVVSPRPPSFSRRDAVACRRIWREWYESHGGEFEFTNDFLFEVESPVEGVPYLDGSSTYVLGGESINERPT